MSTYEWTSTIIQFLIFVAAIIYSFVAYRQWTSLQTANEQTTKLAETAATQANAAIEANKIARESLEVTQRAYINIEDVTFEGFRTGGPFKVHWTIRNSGHAPATGVQEFFARSMGHTYPAAAVGGGRFIQPSKNGGDVIGPGEERKYDTTLTGEYPKELKIPEEAKLTPEKIKEVLAGHGSLGLTVAVSYFDGFDKPRITWRVYNWDAILKTFVQTQSNQE